MIKLIILDRDGVINKDSPNYIKSPSEWQALPGSLEAIAKLKKNGFKVAVATNQAGVGRGYFSLEILEDIHKKMRGQIKAVGGNIDQIFFCPHKPDDNCDCRKPKPGLLLQAAKAFNVDPSEIVMIGDSIKDIIAAKNCGAKSLFVKTGYKEKDILEAKEHDVLIFSDLAEAADYLCNNSTKPAAVN